MKNNSQNFFDMFNANDDLKINALLSANINFNCIQLAVKYDLFTHLEDGINELNSLAKKNDFIPSRLYRLLKCLENINLIKETSDKNFYLTRMGERFLPNKKGNYANLTNLWSTEFYKAAENIDKALRSEKSAFECTHNESLYSYFNKYPERATTFNLAMRDLSENLNKNALYEMDLSTVKSIADVGGGSGASIRNMITQNAHLHGILFDQKSVIDSAMKEMEDFQYKNRVELISGDFFKPLPFKVDCIVLSNIIHNWNDEKAVQILTNCRKALNESGKIYLIEAALESSIEPLLARTMDFAMLLLTEGKERTFSEFEKLFHLANLKFESAKNVLNMTCLIEVKEK
ncbi:methyltransferase [Fluviispira sanaruensis]|uniref:Methyltransferase n=1 Tax=Fluviispira sanaruensis TaxID=2493639 RepID=A0A4P2VQ81_FLUSA|nr:methyltransferase [Fluviispira sanaruensis]BBH54139.1 methyltransferase [Fluviispira sanaruensis]